jgi:hypothetical protein
MTRHSLERRHSSRRARLETWTLIKELIDDFDTTREEGGEEGSLEIATSDSLRQTAHHEDKENAGIAMALATNAGTKRSKIRKLSLPRQKKHVHGKATANQSIQTGSRKKFFLDSGTTKNMSFQRRFFNNFKKIQPVTWHQSCKDRFVLSLMSTARSSQ